MTTFELSIGFAFPLILMVIGYWKEEVWSFYIASVAWLVFMGFLFNNYSDTDFMWYMAWLCLGMALICATAQLWMNKGKPIPTQPEETIEDKREARSKKLSGLRNLGNKIRGRDY